MEIKEVLITACCKDETGIKALLQDKQALKNHLNGSPYLIRGEVDAYEEDVSGYPAISLDFSCRGDYSLERFRGAVSWLLEQLPTMEIATAWGLGWEGPGSVIPEDRDKMLVASYHWSNEANRLFERRRVSAINSSVHVHTEDYQQKAQPAQ